MGTNWVQHETADGVVSTVHSVDKALAIAELLLRRGEALSAREVAELTRINRTTAHRLLSALLVRGWVEKVPGTAGYRTSLRFLALARLSLVTRDFVAEVRPALERLSRMSRETVHLGILDGFEIVHVDKVDSPQMVGVSSKVGTRAVPHLTALGKALLAAGDDAAFEAYLAFARWLPEPSAPDEARLRGERALARERGYSVDDEESSLGVRCVGVAVRGVGGVPLLAISLTGPSPRFTPERVEACVPDLLLAAHLLSLQFGWEPPEGEVAVGDGVRRFLGRG